MTFDEASSTFLGDRLPSGDTAKFFKGFYDGLRQESMPWYPYEDPYHLFELSVKFRFEDANADGVSKKIFKSIIIPCVLPAHLYMGKIQQSFECYHPSIVTRQLGFGQATI